MSRLSDSLKKFAVECTTAETAEEIQSEQIDEIFRYMADNYSGGGSGSGGIVDSVNGKHQKNVVLTGEDISVSSSDTETIEEALNNVSKIIQVDENQTVNGYQVPKLTKENIIELYNSIVAGHSALVTDATGNYTYQVTQADATDSDTFICLIFCDIMILTYGIVSDEVTTTFKAFNGGGEGAVSSVNGKTGAVELLGSDIAVSDEDERTIEEALSDITAPLWAEVSDKPFDFLDSSDTSPFEVIGHVLHLNLVNNSEINNWQTWSSQKINIEKQDKLVAGENITIVDNVISATGGGEGAVSSVNGKTGAVVLAKADLGLGAVDNTSDVTKKANFGGNIAEGDYGFAIGDDVFTELGKKQDNLVSGENIKTINGVPVIGAGNIEINPGETYVYTLTGVSGTLTSEQTTILGTMPQNVMFLNNQLIFTYSEKTTNISTWQCLSSGILYEIEVTNSLTRWNLKTDKVLETQDNKVTTISSSSTDNQYPSAKCVYSAIGNVESVLHELTRGGGV